MDNFENWKARLHKIFKVTMYGCDNDEEYQKASDNFDEALKEALSADSDRYEYAQELMSLFCNDEDYGTLESCFRVLSNMNKNQLMVAFEAYGPKLQKNSKFWYNEVYSLLRLDKDVKG